MSRLPYLRHDDLDASGQAVWDGVVGSRAGQLVNASGGLIGPFNAWLRAPAALVNASPSETPEQPRWSKAWAITDAST